MFRSGVCSWTDPSLISCGKFYKKKGKQDDYLQFYATKMACVEVDASTYVIPTVNRIKKWAAATPKGFVFHLKAHQIFTHGHSEYQKLPRLIREDWPHPQGATAKEIALEDIPEAIQQQLMFLFNLALKELHQADKLGVVVFQFPESFQCTEANKALILKFRNWLDAPFRMGLELRSDTWFFDGTDHADFKSGARPVPQDTSHVTNRFRETLEFVERAAPNMTLVPIDEYAARDAKPSEAVPFPRRVTPIVTQLIGDEMYVRVHRRVGEDRLLTDRELNDWAARIQAMPVKPRRFWMLWNTNFEMQAFENAARLEALLPPPLVHNYKQAYLEAQKSNKGSIFAFFGAAQKPAGGVAAPSPKKDGGKNHADDDDDDDDDDDEDGGYDESVKSALKKRDLPSATVQAAAAASPKKAKPDSGSPIKTFFNKKE